MEKGEPSLVPEWLRSTGSGPGGGNSNHHLASSHSDGPVLALPKRNRLPKGSNNTDAHHSSFLDRSLSSNSRRSSSSNGSTKYDRNYSRSYTSFNRNFRDRDKEISAVPDHWDTEFSDPLRSFMSGRIEKDPLRRSQSLVSRVQGDVLPRKIYTDSRGGVLINNDNINGSSVSVPAGIQKVSFEKDFPSLGSEERPVTPELSRVPSPVLSRGLQSLPVVNSALSTGDGWTSALAEVPSYIGSTNTGSSPALKSAVSTLGAGAAATAGGLNMAEALVHTPVRPHSSQNSVQNHRFEELAVRQSKRLIPMTPSMPKISVLNPSDKLKPKTAPRSTDLAVVPKNGSVRVEVPKASHTGKLLVLKSGWENGVAPAIKDVTSPTANVNNRSISVGAMSIAPVPSKSPVNPKLAGDRKAQAQSRTDFFNSVRKKSMNSSSSVSADSSPVLSSASAERSDEEHKEDVASNPTGLFAKDSASPVIKCNGDASMVKQGLLLASDEEQELAFMRSLGWEPDSGVDEGLTEEEIKGFFEKYMKEGKPTTTLKRCQVVQERIAPEPEENNCLNGDFL
ncbi:hypothetical protein Dimus_006806 [Dionaea muscipula]